MLGMAIGKESSKSKQVAVIGDGAITGGMAFEALAHAGSLEDDLLVILNDNNMSISNNIGGVSNYLNKFGPVSGTHKLEKVEKKS